MEILTNQKIKIKRLFVTHISDYFDVLFEKQCNKQMPMDNEIIFVISKFSHFTQSTSHCSNTVASLMCPSGRRKHEEKKFL